MASISSLALSTGTLTYGANTTIDMISGITTVDAITDAEYAAPVADTRHPVVVVAAPRLTYNSS